MLYCSRLYSLTEDDSNPLKGTCLPSAPIAPAFRHCVPLFLPPPLPRLSQPPLRWNSHPIDSPKPGRHAYMPTYTQLYRCVAVIIYLCVGVINQADARMKECGRFQNTCPSKAVSNHVARAPCSLRISDAQVHGDIQETSIFVPTITFYYYKKIPSENAQLPWLLTSAMSQGGRHSFVVPSGGSVDSQR